VYGGFYSPEAVSKLDPEARQVLLSLVGGGALIGSLAGIVRNWNFSRESYVGPLMVAIALLLLSLHTAFGLFSGWAYTTPYLWPPMLAFAAGFELWLGLKWPLHLMPRPKG
jgi:hypothetical protein